MNNAPDNSDRVKRLSNLLRYVDFPTYEKQIESALNQFNTLFRYHSKKDVDSCAIKESIIKMMVLYANVIELTPEELQTPGLYQKLDEIQFRLQQFSNYDNNETAWALTRKNMFKAYQVLIDHHQIMVLWAMPLTEEIRNKKIFSPEILSLITGLEQYQSEGLVLTGFPPETDLIKYVSEFQHLEKHHIDVLVSANIKIKRTDIIKYIQNGPKNPWWKREYLKTTDQNGQETHVSPLEFLGLLKDLKPHQTKILENLPKELPAGITLKRFMETLKSINLAINETQQTTDIHFEDDSDPDIIQFIIDILADASNIKQETRLKFMAVDENGKPLPDVQGETNYKTMSSWCDRIFSTYPNCKLILKGNLDAEIMKKYEFNFSYLPQIIVNGNFICCQNDQRLPYRVTKTLDLGKNPKGTINQKTVFPMAAEINFRHSITGLDILIVMPSDDKTLPKDIKSLSPSKILNLKPKQLEQISTILPIGVKRIFVEPARLKDPLGFAIASLLLKICPELEIFDINNKKFANELPKKVEPIKPKPEPETIKPVQKIVKPKIPGQHLDYDDLVKDFGKQPEFIDIPPKELKRLIQRAIKADKTLKTEILLRNAQEVTCITTTQTEKEKETETLVETITRKVHKCLVDIITSDAKHEEEKQQRQLAKNTPISPLKSNKTTEKKSTQKTQQPIKIKKYISATLYDEIDQYSHNADEILRNINEINLDPFDMNPYGMRYTGPIAIIKDGEQKLAQRVEKRPGACLVQSPNNLPLSYNPGRIVWNIGKNEKGELVIVCVGFCKSHNEQYKNYREIASVKDRIYTRQELSKYIDIEEWLTILNGNTLASTTSKTWQTQH